MFLSTVTDKEGVAGEGYQGNIEPKFNINCVKN